MRSKYSNEFKRKVLENRLDRQVARDKRLSYKESFRWLEINEYGEMDFVMINNIYGEFMKECKKKPELDCALRLNESKYRKAKRVRSKIEDLVLTGQAIFITLTFTDSTLAKTTEITRRRYVARYLKENCSNYVANIDYGGKKGREHYHALVSNDIDLTKWHKLGAIQVERVKTSDTDAKRVALYVSKLTNHALKLHEVAPRLIYSRK